MAAYLQKAKDLAADYADDGVINDSIHTGKLATTTSQTTSHEIGIPHLASSNLSLEQITSTLSGAMDSFKSLLPSDFATTKSFGVSDLTSLAPVFSSLSHLSIPDLTKAGTAATPLLQTIGSIMGKGITPGDHNTGFDYLSTFKSMAGPALFALGAKNLPTGLKVMPFLSSIKSLLASHGDVTKFEATPPKAASSTDLTHLAAKFSQLESVLGQMAPSSIGGLRDLTSLAPALSSITNGLGVKDILAAGSLATPVLSNIGNLVSGWMGSQTSSGTPLDGLMQLSNTFGPALTLLGGKTAGVDLSSVLGTAKSFLDGFVVKDQTGGIVSTLSHLWNHS